MARASCETPDSLLFGITWYACARNVIPRNIAMARMAMATSVAAYDTNCVARTPRYEGSAVRKVCSFL